MRDGDAIPAYLRLMELDRGGGRLAGAGRKCHGGSWRSTRWLPAPYRGLARAAEQLGQRDEAIGGLSGRRAA